MKGDIGEMENTPFEQCAGPYLSRSVQRQRLTAVLSRELTPHQRRVVVGYYLQNKTLLQMAAEYGVNKTPVWRTLKRGEARLRRCLRY